MARKSGGLKDWLKRRGPKAGGIVIAGCGEELRVLLLSNRAGKRWIFPKGRIRPGESSESASLREAAEEAGVGGLVLGYAGAVTAWERGWRVRTEYFLIQAVRLYDPEPGRRVRWCTATEAESLLGKRLRRLWLRTAPKCGEAA